METLTLAALAAAALAYACASLLLVYGLITEDHRRGLRMRATLGALVLAGAAALPFGDAGLKHLMLIALALHLAADLLLARFRVSLMGKWQYYMPAAVLAIFAQAIYIHIGYSQSWSELKLAVSASAGVVCALLFIWKNYAVIDRSVNAKLSALHVAAVTTTVAVAGVNAILSPGTAAYWVFLAGASGLWVAEISRFSLVFCSHSLRSDIANKAAYFVALPVVVGAAAMLRARRDPWGSERPPGTSHSRRRHAARSPRAPTHPPPPWNRRRGATD